MKKTPNLAHIVRMCMGAIGLWSDPLALTDGMDADRV
jgi:hypothetical protein